MQERLQELLQVESSEPFHVLEGEGTPKMTGSSAMCFLAVRAKVAQLGRFCLLLMCWLWGGCAAAVRQGSRCLRCGRAHAPRAPFEARSWPQWKHIRYEATYQQLSLVLVPAVVGCWCNSQASVPLRLYPCRPAPLLTHTHTHTHTHTYTYKLSLTHPPTHTHTQTCTHT